MKKIFCFIALLAIFLFNIFGQKDKQMKTIFIIGDSTASDYGTDRYPRTGWGQVLQNFFDKNKIVVKNRALSGRSSKSFYDEKAWENVLKELKEGDYLLIQFGHNDEKKEDPSRYTEPFSTFKEYLKIYINGAKSKGVTPILLTPIHRNKWKENKLEDTHKEYLIAIRELAKEQNVLFIDIAEKTKNLFESMGQDKMNEIFLILPKGKYKNYPDGIVDNTHLQENGAIKIASLIVEAIKELKLDIASFVTK